MASNDTTTTTYSYNVKPMVLHSVARATVLKKDEENEGGQVNVYQPAVDRMVDEDGKVSYQLVNSTNEDPDDPTPVSFSGEAEGTVYQEGTPITMSYLLVTVKATPTSNIESSRSKGTFTHHCFYKQGADVVVNEASSLKDDSHSGVTFVTDGENVSLADDEASKGWTKFEDFKLPVSNPTLIPYLLKMNREKVDIRFKKTNATTSLDSSVEFNAQGVLVVQSGGVTVEVAAMFDVYTESQGVSTTVIVAGVVAVAGVVIVGAYFAFPTMMPLAQSLVESLI